MSWRYRGSRGRRIEAMNRVLRVLENGPLADPELLRATDLGLRRMYGALRQLRGQGMIEVRRQNWHSLRRWSQVDDAEEGEIVGRLERR